MLDESISKHFKYAKVKRNRFLSILNVLKLNETDFKVFHLILRANAVFEMLVR